MFKKVISIIVSAAIGCSMLAVTASAADWHNNPGGGKCDNTYYFYQHRACINTYQISSHQTTDGRTCYVYLQVFRHMKICSSCGAELGTVDIDCTTFHTICNIRSVTCGC